MGFMHPDVHNEQACVDINECELFHNLCVYGQCENVFGMFRCVCDSGYKLDDTGGNCTDIDECEKLEVCVSGTCVNQRGAYKCECPPNYELVDSGDGCIG